MNYSQFTGVTESERYLQKLAKRSFLSLWCLPNVYSDRGKQKEGQDGKEVADLLVVFDNHIIIFSDKDYTYPDSADPQLNWRRWYKRAIQNSADQLWGAERWIRDFPERLYLDRKCTVPLPFPLPNPSNARFHLISVAHNASQYCRSYLGGSGSLMIQSDLIGDDHYSENCRPFAIGKLNPNKTFIHVLDDTTLDVLLSTLDTILDFVSYLDKKVALFNKIPAIFAAGEDDLLAYYLQNINNSNEHDFVLPDELSGLFLDEGVWNRYNNHPQRKAQIEADKVSYIWDDLIEEFSHHALTDTQYYTSHPGIASTEQILRRMAREQRTKRRMLSKAIQDAFERSKSTNRLARVSPPQSLDDTCYIFLFLAKPDFASYEDYRNVRLEMLYSYCKVAKLMYPHAQHIVGIATETYTTKSGSEDAAYLDAREWSSEQEEEAKQLQSDLGLLKNLEMYGSSEKEYPDLRASKSLGIKKIRMKGRDRNKPCPCGSGKKFKKCCGKSQIVNSKSSR